MEARDQKALCDQVLEQLGHRRFAETAARKPLEEQVRKAQGGGGFPLGSLPELLESLAEELELPRVLEQELDQDDPVVPTRPGFLELIVFLGLLQLLIVLTRYFVMGGQDIAWLMDYRQKIMDYLDAVDTLPRPE